MASAPCASRLQWRRETPSSSRRMSAPSLRPMRTTRLCGSLYSSPNRTPVSSRMKALFDVSTGATKGGVASVRSFGSRDFPMVTPPRQPAHGCDLRSTPPAVPLWAGRQLSCRGALFFALRGAGSEHARCVPRTAPIQPIDPLHPQPRHVQRAVTILEEGGLVSYPTDTYYAIGCDLFQKKAMERLAVLKRRDSRKPFAFLCADLGEVARYGIVSNENYRLMRRLLPGPYTFNLEATRLVPRTALTRQRQVGVRVPDAPVALALVRGLGRPLATTSAALPPDDEPMIDARDIQRQLGNGIDLILDGGVILNEPSTVLDLTGPAPVVLREGKGKIAVVA